VKIVVDARWIFPRLSGIGLYTRELIERLAAAGGGHTYVLLFQRPDVEARVRRSTRLDRAPNVRFERVADGIFSPTGQWRMPRRLRRWGADVFHSTNYFIPYAAFPRSGGGRTRCVATVHDLIPLLFPQYTPRALKTRLMPLFRRLLRETVRRADAVIVPSECSRRDVLRHLGMPAGCGDRVVVVPQGVDARFRPAPEPAREPWLLYVGRFDPYKNVPRLVEVFARVRERVPDARLRIVGEPDPRYPEARRTAERLGLGDETIRWDGYLGDEGLVAAYQGAAAAVLLSSYEGFGLPVLEAMACGVPVVCSDCASLPEVAGDAAMLVPPDDPDAAAGALVRVLTDRALAAGMREKGLRRAAAFTWEETARRTLEVYERAAGGT